MLGKGVGKSNVVRPLLVIVLVLAGALALSGCVQLTTSKSKVTIKPGKSKTITVTAYNPTAEELMGSGTGAYEYTEVQVCAESPKVIKVTPKCRAADKIGIGETIKGKFKIKVKSSAKKKKAKTYTVTFVGSDNEPNPDRFASIKVKVPATKK